MARQVALLDDVVRTSLRDDRSRYGRATNRVVWRGATGRCLHWRSSRGPNRARSVAFDSYDVDGYSCVTRPRVRIETGAALGVGTAVG